MIQVDASACVAWARTAFLRLWRVCVDRSRDGSATTSSAAPTTYKTAMMDAYGSGMVFFRKDRRQALQARSEATFWNRNASLKHARRAKTILTFVARGCPFG